MVLFAFITWLGFAAAHWRKGDLDLLHEWGLGGRRFGTLIRSLPSRHLPSVHLLVGWAVGTVAGTWMFIAANLTPNYPLAIGGYTFPGYSALYTVILNLLVTIVLTPVFNALGGRQGDATVAADYYA